ncbi:MAG: thermonuclease family protein [Corticimicrobacter sp.]|uniref:thermonuclease family protein n=1 Tax=Corticimicrobacter sp. TaxID=2678536 RepID=UPI0032DB18EC
MRSPRTWRLLISAALAVLAWWSLQSQNVPEPARQPAVENQTTRREGHIPAADTYMLHGEIVNVADGDTVTLRAGTARHRVRLASIDAPETGSDGRPGQPHGRAAADALRSLVQGRTLDLRCYETDQYGRDVCDLLEDNAGRQTYNARMVEAGWAWANMQGRGRHLRDDSLRTVERQAQQARRGLWADADPVPPWQWRYDCWQQQRCGSR